MDKELNIPYNKEKATAQVNQLIDVAIRGLCKLNKPFKYSVTAVLMQSNGAGINSCGKECLIQSWPTTTRILMVS